MKTYTTAELNEVLKKHSDWLNNRPDGIPANLSGANLRYANLNDANLRYANLSGANLNGADLNGADLNGANLRYANLSGANLNGAVLSGANLSGANLRYANLNDANLRYANLNDANLRYANLSGANLNGADLSDVRYNEATGFYALACPETGSFIGWKKAMGKIVKLEICEDALRSSATTRKCRCSAARVLAIENIDGTNYGDAVCSNHDKSFIYKVGEIVSVGDFDTNRWNECAPGIHFFITRDEVVRY